MPRGTMPYAARASWTILRSAQRRRHADGALEDAREVRLVAEPARRGDRGRRLAGRQQRAGARRSAGRAGTRAAAGRPARGTCARARSGSAPRPPRARRATPAPSQRSSRWRARAPDGGVLGPRRGGRPGPGAGAGAARRPRRAPRRRPPARRLARQRAVRGEQRAPQRARRGTRPSARRAARASASAHAPSSAGVEVEHLVRPAAGHRRHPGVHRLRLEHEQLAVAARWSVSSSAKRAAPRSITATVHVGCECGR